MQFRKGDKVLIIAARPECRKYIGRTATVRRNGTNRWGDVSVKGLDSPRTERFQGYHGFAPEHLRKI